MRTVSDPPPAEQDGWTPPTAAEVEPYPDPYDLWATLPGIYLRRQYYRGGWTRQGGAVAMGLLDWLRPEWSRERFEATGSAHPITLGHLVLLRTLRRGGDPGPTEDAAADLDALARSAVQPWASRGRWAWGLGFPWASRHGNYAASMPLVTHTPYVMEALLALARVPEVQPRAMEMFHGTWAFLQSLQEQERSEKPSEKRLALSYGPAVESRVVINANAYAAYAHALHAIHGRAKRRSIAAERAEALVHWVVAQQRPSGRWPYYADREPGNFTDGFHTCFVLKNLRKTARLLPGLQAPTAEVIDKGWSFVGHALMDPERGLCQRFVDRPFNGPFRWDLYDQAEVLGVHVDREEWTRAAALIERTEEMFRVGDDWYCRIDVFNRPWGRGHLRWGIVPWWYQRERFRASSPPASM